MPIHDWTRVDAGLFHDFHQTWSVQIKAALNAGLLPEGYYALVEQRVGGPEPDVIAVETGRGKKGKHGGTTALAEPPRTRVVKSRAADAAAYASKANRISIRHYLGAVVAVIEIVSPGNKSSRAAVRAFVEMALGFLYAGVHLLVIDLFPPTRRDPQGLPAAIWEEFTDESFDRPAAQPVTFVGYDAGPPLTAYLETVAVGDKLPPMPLFLARGTHIPVPLDDTYAATWADTPEPIRDRLAPTPPRRRK